MYSSLALLMVQALVSRIFQPGFSNFVNASVRRFASPARVGMCCACGAMN
jgi:hypothetical protein